LNQALPASAAHRRSRRWLTVVCVLLSAHFTVAYNTLTVVMFSFQRAISLNNTPLDYRLLTVLIYQAFMFLVSPLRAHHPTLHLPYLNYPFSSDLQWFICVLTFVGMFATLMVTRRLLRVIDGHWAFEWLALAMVYMAYFDTILVLNRNLYYPYDILALFFFTLLVYLAYIDQPVWIAILLVPAILNKETACMAGLVYFCLYFGRKPIGRLVAICGGFALISFTVRTVQQMYMHHRCPACTQMLRYELGGNLHQMLNPLFWLSESAVFGYAWVSIFFFWRYVPARIRWTAIITYAAWTLSLLFTGILREVRIFSEVSIIVVLVTATGIHHYLQARKSTTPAAERTT